MRKAVGVHLAGEYPTPEERAKLINMAAQSGLTLYDVKRVIAWDASKRRRIVRLDAIEIG